MFEFLTQHQFWTAVVIYWIYSAAVSSMPDPAEIGSPRYLWLYRFCHTIAGNITKAFLEAARDRACASRNSSIPGLKTVGLVVVVPLLLSTTACAAHYRIHPGALNRTDSAGYDALLIAETTIDQARMHYKSAQLPAAAKEGLNTLIKSYNAARESWLMYRGAIATNVPTQTYFDQLSKNLTDLTNAIRAFEETK